MLRPECKFVPGKEAVSAICFPKVRCPLIRQLLLGYDQVFLKPRSILILQINTSGI